MEEDGKVLSSEAADTTGTKSKTLGGMKSTIRDNVVAGLLSSIAVWFSD